MSSANTRKDHFHVYVIELHPSVLTKGRYAEANPGYVYNPQHPPLYVGMTGRTPEVRFSQHQSGYKSSRYTKSHALKLRPDLYAILGTMSYEQARRWEMELAERLRLEGYAVWQN